MSAPGAQRLLIGFGGAVECRREDGPVNLILRGLERPAGPASRTASAARGTAAEALFAAATAATSTTEAATATDASAGAGAPDGGLAALPARLHEVELYELWAAGGAPGRRHFLLCARELRLSLECRGLQLHRDVGHAFSGAVPPARLSWQRRLGWMLLLWALRLPGAGALLSAPGDEP